MADKNITMKQYNGTDYDNLYPTTIPAQIDGVIPISKGGTNATTASEARNNLGLGSLATKNTAGIADGGTGTTVRYDTFTIADGDSEYFAPSSNVVARYFPYLRLCYISFYTTVKKTIEAGADIDMGTVEDANYIPASRKPLCVAMSGVDTADAILLTDGSISLYSKTRIVKDRVITVTGIYHI